MPSDRTPVPNSLASSMTSLMMMKVKSAVAVVAEAAVEDAVDVDATTLPETDLLRLDVKEVVNLLLSRTISLPYDRFEK